MYYSWVLNKRPLPVINFEFFSNPPPNAWLDPLFIYYSKYFLITCTKLSNIKFSVIKYEKNMWKTCKKNIHVLVV